MIINRSGLIIRLSVEDLRVMGRATQGVRLINLKDDDSIASVAKVEVIVSDDEEFNEIDNLDNEDLGDENIQDEEIGKEIEE